jgi:hypothetical protein
MAKSLASLCAIALLATTTYALPLTGDIDEALVRAHGGQPASQQQKEVCHQPPNLTCVAMRHVALFPRSLRRRHQEMAGSWEGVQRH